MTDLPEFDELLSAYLDDELSAGDRRHVEQSLRDDRELQQTFEELRSIRAAIQSLPPLQLDKNFYQRVLQRAERSTLDGQSPQDTQVSSIAHDRETPNDPGWSRRPGLQSFAIACAALAALVLVAVVLPRRWTRDQIAMHAPTDQMEAVVDEARSPAPDVAAPDVAGSNAAAPSNAAPDDALSSRVREPMVDQPITNAQALNESSFGSPPSDALSSAPQRPRAMPMIMKRKGRGVGPSVEKAEPFRVESDSVRNQPTGPAVAAESPRGSFGSMKGAEKRVGKRDKAAKPQRRSAPAEMAAGERAPARAAARSMVHESPQPRRLAAPLSEPPDGSEAYGVGSDDTVSAEAVMADQPHDVPPLPEEERQRNRPQHQITGQGLPPAAVSDYVVFVSGSTRRQIGNALRTALTQNRIVEMPAMGQQQAAGQRLADKQDADETAPRLVLVEAPIELVQATVKTLSADRTNVHSLLAFSQSGDGHRVLLRNNDAIGEPLGRAARGLSWKNAVETAEQEDSNPDDEAARSRMRRSPGPVAAEPLAGESLVATEWAAGMKQRAPRRAGVAADVETSQLGEGRAWFFSYSSGDAGIARGEALASDVKSQQQALRALPSRSVNAVDLTTGTGGRALEESGEKEDATKRDAAGATRYRGKASDEMLSQQRKSLRRRIGNLKMPDALKVEPPGEDQDRRTAGKEASDVAKRETVEAEGTTQGQEKDDGANKESVKPNVARNVLAKSARSSNQKMVRVLFVLQPEGEAVAPAEAHEEH